MSESVHQALVALFNQAVAAAQRGEHNEALEL